MCHWMEALEGVHGPSSLTIRNTSLNIIPSQQKCSRCSLVNSHSQDHFETFRNFNLLVYHPSLLPLICYCLLRHDGWVITVSGVLSQGLLTDILNTAKSDMKCVILRLFAYSKETFKFRQRIILINRVLMLVFTSKFLKGEREGGRNDV